MLNTHHVHREQKAWDLKLKVGKCGVAKEQGFDGAETPHRVLRCTIRRWADILRTVLEVPVPVHCTCGSEKLALSRSWTAEELTA